MVRTIGDENAWKKPVMRRGADVRSLLVTVVIAYKQTETFQAAMRHFMKETRSGFTNIFLSKCSEIMSETNYNNNKKSPGPGSHARPTNIAVHESARARSAF